VTSGLVAECLDALSVLANRNEVTLIWVPGYCGVPGNEKADELATIAVALAIPRCSATDAIKNWTELQHFIAWKN
jgi:ribonuclease HI